MKKVKRSLQSRHESNRAKSRARAQKLNPIETLEPRVVLSGAVTQVSYIWNAPAGQTVVKYDGDGNCRQVKGPEAAAHRGCELGGGSGAPNAIAVTYSKPVFANSVGLSDFRLSAPADADVNDPFRARRARIPGGKPTGRTVWVNTTGDLPNDADTNLRFRIAGVRGVTVKNVRGERIIKPGPWMDNFLGNHTIVAEQGGANDFTPPQISSVFPYPGREVASSPSRLKVYFSEAISQSTITASNFELYSSGGDGVFNNGNDLRVNPRLVDYFPDHDMARFLIDAPLDNDTYQIVVSGTNAVRDLAGNRLDGNGDGNGGDRFVSTFRVNAFDNAGPHVVSTTPAPGAVLAAAPPELLIGFNEPLNGSTVNGSTVQLLARGLDGSFTTPVATTASYNAATREISVSGHGGLNDDVYRVAISGVRDSGGNLIDGNADGINGDSFVLNFAVSERTGKIGGDPPDPLGDTTVSDGFGRVTDPARTHDIEAVGAFSDDFTAYFQIDFFGTIQPPSEALVNSLFGFIDVDSDEDNLTGAPHGAPLGDSSQMDILGEQGASHMLGDEFYIDLGSEAVHSEQVDIYGTTTGQWLLDTDGSRSLTGTEVNPFVFQAIGTQTFQGDWNGDGADDFGSIHISSSSLQPRNLVYLDRDGNRAYDPNEDIDGDGQLDVKEIDLNANGILDPSEDIDGDGKFDEAEDRDNDGILDNDGPFVFGSPVQFGNAQVLVGDTDGDGSDNIVLYQDGRFLIDVNGNFTEDIGDMNVAFGQLGDVGVLADFDGDSRAEIAVFKPDIGLGPANLRIDINNDYLFQSTVSALSFEQQASGELPDILLPSTEVFSPPSGIQPGDQLVVADWDGYFEIDFSGDGNEDLNGDGIFNNGLVFGGVGGLLNEIVDRIDYNGDGTLDAAVSEDLNGDGFFNNGLAAPLLADAGEDINSNGVIDSRMADMGWFRPGTSELFLDVDAGSTGGIFDFSRTDGSIGRAQSFLPSEDINGDGQLTVAEDINGNGALDQNDGPITFGQFDGIIPPAGATDTIYGRDFNGNGVDEVGFFRPSTNEFFLDLSGDGFFQPGVEQFTFGTPDPNFPNDVGVVGDLDGDGDVDISLFQQRGDIRVGVAPIDYQLDRLTIEVPLGLVGETTQSGFLNFGVVVGAAPILAAITDEAPNLCPIVSGSLDCTPSEGVTPPDRPFTSGALTPLPIVGAQSPIKIEAVTTDVILGSGDDLPAGIPPVFSSSTGYPTVLSVSFTGTVDSQTINLDTVQIVNTGGDGVFGNGNDVLVPPTSIQILSVSTTDDTINIFLPTVPQLPGDDYQLVISGDPVVRDQFGIPVDGEFQGFGTGDINTSGDDRAGGTFVMPFRIDRPATINFVRLTRPTDRGVPEVSDTGVIDDGLTNDQSPTFLGMVSDDRIRSSSDPTGDVFSLASGGPDLTGISAEYSTAAQVALTSDPIDVPALHVALTFQNLISLPGDNANAPPVYGSVDLDTDQSETSGGVAWFIDLNGDSLFDPLETTVVTPTTTTTTLSEGPIRFGAQSGDVDMPTIPVAGNWFATVLGSDVTELGVYDPVSSQWSVDRNGDGVIQPTETAPFLTTSLATRIPLVGNFDGDITNGDEQGEYDPVTGDFFLDTDTAGFGRGVFTVGLDTLFRMVDPIPGLDPELQDIPIVGDWNDDGRDEVGVYRPSGVFPSAGPQLFPNKGMFFIDANGDSSFQQSEDTNGDGGFTPGSIASGGEDANLNGQLDLNDGPFPFGSLGALPVIGDWDGSGGDKIGIYNPALSAFTLDLSGDGVETPGEGPFSFGVSGNLPVVGDFTGNNVDQIGVYDPLTGSFVLDLNENRIPELIESQIFAGQVGEVPVVGVFDVDDPTVEGIATFRATSTSNQTSLGVAPGSGLGTDFIIDLSSEADHAGLVDIVDARTNEVVVQAQVTLFPDQLGIQVTIPLSAISDDGLVNFGVLVGSETEFTDEAPTTGVARSSQSVLINLETGTDLSPGSFDNGTVVTGGFGKFVLTTIPTVPGQLADGIHNGVGANDPQLNFQVIDEAGNATNKLRSVAVDTDEPQYVAYAVQVEGSVSNEFVETFQTTPEYFQVTADEELHPGLATDFVNVSLFTADGVDQSAFLSNITYNPGPTLLADPFDEDLNNNGIFDPDEDRDGDGIFDRFPDIQPRSIRVHTEGDLPSGIYVLTFKDDITDLAGNAVDGENFGNSAFPPSGDGIPGGDFQVTFTIDPGPPRIVGVSAIIPSGPDGVVGTSDDLTGGLGADANYGPDGLAGTPDDAAVPFMREFFDPAGVDANLPFIAVRVEFDQPIDPLTVTPERVLLTRTGNFGGAADGDFENGPAGLDGFTTISAAPGWPATSDFSNDDHTLLFRVDPAELPLTPDFYRLTVIGGGTTPPPDPVGANVDVSANGPTPAPEYQGEPVIEISLNDPDLLVVAANDDDGRDIAIYRSDSGGGNFTPIAFDSNTVIDPNAGVLTYDESRHAQIVFDRTDQVFVSYIARDDNGGQRSVAVATSNDGGLSFQVPRAVTTSDVALDQVIDDFPWISVDNTLGSVNNLFVTWTRQVYGATTDAITDFPPNDSEILFTRSEDSGISFVGDSADLDGDGDLTEPIRINDFNGVNGASNGAGNAVSVVGVPVGPGLPAPVYVVWEDWGGNLGGTDPVTLRFDRSFDGGERFIGIDGSGSDILIPGQINVNGFSTGGNQFYGITAQPGTLGGNNLDFRPGIAAKPVMAVDTSGGPFNGRIYLAYVDNISVPFTQDDTDIFLRFSDDQGLTWSGPQQVNDIVNDGNDDSASQFDPTLEVDPISGQAVVTWYDTRLDDNHAEANVFLSVVTPGLSTLNISPDIQISDFSSNESLLGNPPTAPEGYGQYMGVEFFDGIVYPVWTDTRLKDGDFDPAEEIFISRVDLTVLTTTGSLVDGITDKVGNQLDGEAIGVSENGIGVPSGDGLAGGNFVTSAIVGGSFINVDSSFEEDPFILSNGDIDNPFATLQRGLAASPGLTNLGPTIVKVANGDGAPYIVEPGPGGLDGTVVVDDLTVLNIEAGSILKLRASNIEVQGIGAAIQSRGTVLDPVRFTSTLNDDAIVGGDTNGDGTNSTPSGGDWGGIVFRAGADNPLSIVDQAVIDFAGGPVPTAIGPRYDTLFLDSTPTRPASPALTNLTITNAIIPGEADGMQFAISANLNSFVDSTNAATDGSADGTVGPLIRNVTLRDNSVNGLWVRPSSATGQAVLAPGAIARWDDPVVHVLDSLLTIPGSGTDVPTTLIIEPGMVVKGLNAAIQVAPGARFDIGRDGPGDLRTVLTSFYDDTAGFPDAGFDTNNDGVVGIDVNATAPQAGDWAGLGVGSSLDSPTFMLIDETDVRYGGGTHPLANVVPSLGIAGPGYYQLTRNTFEFDATFAPIQVSSEVLRADVPFDVESTTLANEFDLNENPLIRGNTLVNNNNNGMIVLPVRSTSIDSSLVSSAAYDINSNGQIEIFDGIDIIFDDTDITHLVTSSLGLPGAVAIPDPVEFTSRSQFLNVIATDPTALTSLERVDFEVDPRTNVLFRPLGRYAGDSRANVPNGDSIANEDQYCAGFGGNPWASQGVSFSTPSPVLLCLGGLTVPAGTPIGGTLATDPVLPNVADVDRFTPTSGALVQAGLDLEWGTLDDIFVQTVPNAPGVADPTTATASDDVTITTASALTTRHPSGNDSMDINFSRPVFAAGFNLVGSNITDALERIIFHLEDINGTAFQIPITRGQPAPTVPALFGSAYIGGFPAPGDNTALIAQDSFFVGMVGPNIITRIQIIETTGPEDVPVGTNRSEDHVGIDDLVFSPFPINNPIFGPTVLEPAAVHTLRSNAPGTIIAKPSGEVFEILEQGEPLVVKLLGADTSQAIPTHEQIPRANWGAGFGGGIDDGVDATDSAPPCLRTGTFNNPSRCDEDFGFTAAIRIVGVPGNEATGQPQIPVYLTSLLDDSVGPFGLPQDTNGDGNASTPAPGDWSGIVLGARLSNDRDDLIVDLGPDGLVTPGPGSDDIIDPQAIPVPGTYGRNLQLPNDIIPLPADLDESLGSVISNAVISFGSKIRLQSESRIPPVNQVESLRSVVISNNQILNMSQGGVYATFGIPRNLMLDSVAPSAGIPAFSIDPFILNNVIANIPELNPNGASMPFEGVRVEVDATTTCVTRDESDGVVLHNTFVNNSTAITNIKLVCNQPATSPGDTIAILNNLIVSSSNAPVIGGNVTQFGFNAYFNDPVLGANPVNINLGWSDPSIFINQAAGDFRLALFSDGGEPNPVIDRGISELLPGSRFAASTVDDVIIRLPNADSPMGPETDLFGILRLDDIRVPNLGNGANPFYDIGAIESRDLGAPTILNVEIDNNGLKSQIQPTPPSVPGAVVATSPDEITVEFSEDLDIRTLTNKSFFVTGAGGDGTFFDGNERNIGPQSITFDPILNIATFTPAVPLLEDVYSVTVVGVGANAVTDVQGVRLDGEFNAYPTGDGFPGGTYVSFFSVQIAPQVVEVSARNALETISLDSNFEPGSGFVLSTPPISIDVRFSEEVVIPPDGIKLTAAGVDLIFGSSDDVPIAGQITFDPVTLLARFIPDNPNLLPTDTFYRVEIEGSGNGAIRDMSGLLLDGENNEPITSTSGNGVEGGDWVGFMRVGTVVPTLERAIFVDGSHTGTELGTEEFPFREIQSGVDATDETRDLVLVAPGIYTENIVIDAAHNGATIQSREGDSVTRIVGADPTEPAIDIDLALDVGIFGFQITTSGVPLTSDGNPSGGVGVRVNASTVELSANTIYDNQIGVWANIGTPGAPPLITNNVIWANISRGVEIRGSVNVPAQIVNNTMVFNGEGVRLVDTGSGIPNIANIFNNIIVGSDGSGIRSINTAGATIDFNDVFQNLGGNYVNVASIGSHNISADPLFRAPVRRPLTGRPDPSQANWRLGSFSPAIDAGLGNEDVNGNGILEIDEDFNGNGVLDAPPTVDHDNLSRFDDPLAIFGFPTPDTGLGNPTFVDMGAFERQVGSSGTPGSFSGGFSGGGNSSGSGGSLGGSSGTGGGAGGIGAGFTSFGSGSLLGSATEGLYLDASTSTPPSSSNDETSSNEYYSAPLVQSSTSAPTGSQSQTVIIDGLLAGSGSTNDLTGSVTQSSIPDNFSDLLDDLLERQSIVLPDNGSF